MSDTLAEMAGTLVMFSIEMVTIVVSLDSDKLLTVYFAGSGSVAINCVVV